MAIIFLATHQISATTWHVSFWQWKCWFFNSRPRWLHSPRFVQRSMLIEHQHQHRTLYQHPHHQHQLKKGQRVGDWKTMKKLLSKDRGCILLTYFLCHVTGQPHCSWPVQAQCAWTRTDMHPSSCRYGWMVVGLGKKVIIGTQSRKEGNVESWT